MLVTQRCDLAMLVPYLEICHTNNNGAVIPELAVPRSRVVMSQSIMPLYNGP